MTYPSRFLMAGFSVLSLVLMAYIDYVTGHELIFSAAYLVPVALVAWRFGRGAVTAMSIAGGACTWMTDWLGGKPYSHFFYHYGNSFTCLFICLLVGFLIIHLKGVLDRQKRANDELRVALDEIRRSTEEIRRLQSGLQVVCAWTKRVKVGDEWMTPEQFLATRLGLKLSHGISPDALRELEKQAAEILPEQ
jgi:hypothetical protein